MTVPTYEVTAQLPGLSIYIHIYIKIIVPTVAKDPFMMYITPVYDPLDEGHKLISTLRCVSQRSLSWLHC